MQTVTHTQTNTHTNTNTKQQCRYCITEQKAKARIKRQKPKQKQKQKQKQTQYCYRKTKSCSITCMHKEKVTKSVLKWTVVTLVIKIILKLCILINLWMIHTFGWFITIHSDTNSGKYTD